MPKIDAFLKVMKEKGVSYLHPGAGTVPMLRINGVLERTEHRARSQDELQILIYELLTDTQIEHLETMGELDCAYTIQGQARSRGLRDNGWRSCRIRGHHME